MHKVWFSSYLCRDPAPHHDLGASRVSATKLEQTVDEEPGGQERADGDQGVLLELPHQLLVRRLLMPLPRLSVHCQLSVELTNRFYINLNNLVFSAVLPRSIQTRLFSILLSFRASPPAFLETFSSTHPPCCSVLCF